MRILHVTAGLGRSGAGVRETVVELARAQNGLGANVQVLGLDDSSWREDLSDWDGIAVKGVRYLGPMKYGYSPAMFTHISDFWPDITHVHGLWTHHGRSVFKWASKYSKPFVVSTHGMLSPEALLFSRKKKWVVSFLYQSKMLERASAIHATSLQEEQDIRSFGVKSRIIRFGNGVRYYQSRTLEQFRASDKTILFLGRLHPIKGLEELLRAWGRIEHDLPNWRLLIVGPDASGEARRLTAISKALKLSRVHFHGPVFGDRKMETIRSSDLFVLPSRSENFALTIAESLMAGVPVVTTRGTPWNNVNDIDCGRCVEYGSLPLEIALREMTSLSGDDRYKMGQRGREWMLQNFTWPSIAAQSIHYYQQLINSACFTEY